jgi:hypothetical protein
LPKHGQSSTAFGKKILGVDFNEVKRRQCGEQLAVVGMPPADADGRGGGWGFRH